MKQSSLLLCLRGPLIGLAIAAGIFAALVASSGLSPIAFIRGVVAAGLIAL